MVAMLSAVKAVLTLPHAEAPQGAGKLLLGKKDSVHVVAAFDWLEGFIGRRNMGDCIECNP